MVILRAPSTLPTTEPSPSIAPPTLQWLCGPWNVTHSTLPMWRKNKNVVITYTPVPSTSPPQLDDLVTYQPLSSAKTKTVHGLDKPFSVPDTAAADEGEAAASLAYSWRGKGWLVIASSKWEILAHGDEEGTGNSYVVTFFAKTLFTPAGVDVYSRKGALRAETVETIKAGLAGLGGQVAGLAKEMFEIAMDEERK
ncbi:hypothetical protein DPSP01_007335 [Paraphaeosphaeria sporulosa]|uniref:Uncharacterized protein n=1 Tax=Paraphaeosphaeria sporulosa TaxID=1460663 RepID=A0A177C7P9_9PLEO|nr:uncharacterized protein CC84DRAFT_1166608 [Paraphaeosphaeria sporulosa]OAG02798.1 hypothetical protein CC84DRAFT_1166608 [Paraphaeosphaeria sporulosa]